MNLQASSALQRACICVAFVAATLAAAGTPLHAQTNVALGKTVTGFGSFGGDASRDGFVWPNPAPASLSTLTDGVIVPDGTQWQTGTVWWDRGAFGTPGEAPESFFSTRVEIDLGSVFALTGAGFSFDNNDSYAFFTRNDAADEWQYWFDILCPSCAPGMVSDRFPNEPALFQTARFVAVSAFEGDGFYSLSEIELYAATVPEPGTLLLLAVGLGGLILRARKRNA